jgi:hypothetical protein
VPDVLVTPEVLELLVTSTVFDPDRALPELSPTSEVQRVILVPPEIEGIGIFFKFSCGSIYKIDGILAVTVSTITVILDVSVPPVAELLIVKLTVKVPTVFEDSEITLPFRVSLPTPEFTSEFVTETVFGYVYPLICDSSKGLYCEAVPEEIVIVLGQARVLLVASVEVTLAQVVLTVVELKVDSVETLSGIVSETETLSNSKPVPENLTLLKPVSFLMCTYAYNSLVVLFETPVFGLLQYGLAEVTPSTVLFGQPPRALEIVPASKFSVPPPTKLIVTLFGLFHKPACTSGTAILIKTGN